MKTFNAFMLEVAEPKSGDEKRFKNKHIIQKHIDRAGNDDDVYNAKNIKATKARNADNKESELTYEQKTFYSFTDQIAELEDYNSLMDEALAIENELTDAEMKKREEIVLSLKKKMPEFKKRYGKRATGVMYALATKMANK